MRVLKISKGFRMNALNECVTLPKILLMGRWLQKAGFCPGEQVKVSIHQNRITITKNESA